MSRFEIGCILRVLAKLCYKKVSLKADELMTHDHGSPSREFRLYECFEELYRYNGEIAPVSMPMEEFLDMFVAIDIDQAYKILKNVSSREKSLISASILYVCQTDIINSLGNSFFLNKEDVPIVEEIVTSIGLNSPRLLQILQYTKYINHL